MKKLKLKLDGKQSLSKEQMKKINGGYGWRCVNTGCTSSYTCQQDYGYEYSCVEINHDVWPDLYGCCRQD